MFDGLVGILNAARMVFDRRRQIPCDNLGNVVIQGDSGNFMGVDVTVEFTVMDKGQGVGYGGDMPAVFHHIFFHNIAFQAPALDPFQSFQVGEKTAFCFHDALGR